MMKKKILILCTGNSCRSQMAEGFVNHFGGENFEGVSAGSHPAEAVHPIAIKVMKEEGIDLSQNQPKHLTSFLEEHIDYLVTVCDNAKESCPNFPANVTHFHWSFEDPALAEGTEEEVLNSFRKIRDQIKDKFVSFMEKELRVKS